MHAPLPFQMTVRHFGAWRAASGLLCAFTAGVTVIWAIRAGATIPWWVLFSTLVVTGASLALWRQTSSLQPVSLRWDGQVWHFGPALTAGAEPLAGRVEVSLDLGFWLLLRFVPEISVASRRGIWLPVQRASHQANWHALRATVYCARSVTLPAGAPF